MVLGFNPLEYFHSKTHVFTQRNQTQTAKHSKVISHSKETLPWPIHWLQLVCDKNGYNHPTQSIKRRPFVWQQVFVQWFLLSKCLLRWKFPLLHLEYKIEAIAYHTKLIRPYLMKNKILHKKAFSALCMPLKIWWTPCVIVFPRPLKFMTIIKIYNKCQNDTLINRIKKDIIIMRWIIIDCKGCFKITTLFGYLQGLKCCSSLFGLVY